MTRHLEFQSSQCRPGKVAGKTAAKFFAGLAIMGYPHAGHFHCFVMRKEQPMTPQLSRQKGKSRLRQVSAILGFPTPFMKTPKVFAVLAGLLSLACVVTAQNPQPTYKSSAEFARYAMKLREESILRLEPQVIVPTESNKDGVRGLYPWKLNIVATIFWVGEQAGANNPVHNFSSSWDLTWWRTYGGYDNPNAEGRHKLPDGGTIPAAFVPQQNPFYFALPYNDVTGGRHKSEARKVIPWFNAIFEQEGKSVCRDRWIMVRKGTRACYAQWSDCGPFSTEHWQYVFGNERPRPNLNHGAGLDVSPAVRDYLAMASTDVVDWKFIEYSDIPPGPWARFGENNSFVIDSRRRPTRLAQVQKTARAARGDDDGPIVVTK